MTGTLSYRNDLRRAAEAAAAIAADQGHFPVLADRRLDSVLAPLLWMVHEFDRSEDLPHPGMGRIRMARSLPLDELKLGPETEPATRAVTADWIYRHIMNEVDDLDIELQQDDELSDSDREVELADFRNRELAQLRDYLDVLDVDVVVSDDDLLWELHAAGSAGHARRVVQVCDQLVARRPSADHLGIAIRSVFIALSDLSATSEPKVWVTAWSEPGDDRLWGLQVAFAAFRESALDLEGLLLRRPARSTPMEPDEAVLRVEHWLERLTGLHELTVDERFIRAWAGYRLGSSTNREPFLRAGGLFAHLADREPDGMREPLLMSSAACYVAGGRADLAEPLLLRRAETSRAEARARFDLVCCYYLQGKERQTFEAFQRYVDIRPEGGSDDLLTSLVLKFGALATQRADRRDALIGLAMSSPIREQGEAIVSWLEPYYDALTTSARQRWWAGVFIESSPAMRDLAAEAWSLAAEKFAEAVNLELKERVFRPFSKSALEIVDQLRQDPDRHKEELLVLTDRGTLGQHLRLLSDASKPSPRGPIAVRLAPWLAKRQPPLLTFVASLGGQVMRLNDLRGSATHETVNRAEARETFDLARNFLRALTGTAVPPT